MLVAAATWSLSSQLSITNAIHLRSADGPATTLLDGGDSTRVLLLSHADAIVEGFTLQNGNSGDSSGGGIRIDPDGQLRRCIVRNNTTESSGGGCAIIWDGEVRNCLFYSNTADDKGGGVYSYTESGTPLLDSCTISKNSAVNGGGGYYLLNDAILRNAIVWENTSSSGSDDIYRDPTGAGTIEYTDSGYARTGTGNLGIDPGFVNTTADNFRLALTSGVRQVGSNPSWMTGAVDLDGSPRILYGTNDLGAYEGLLDTVDSDSDRIGDWQEGRAGTDPFDIDSVLGIRFGRQGQSGGSVCHELEQCCRPVLPHRLRHQHGPPGPLHLRGLQQHPGRSPRQHLHRHPDPARRNVLPHRARIASALQLAPFGQMQQEIPQGLD